MNYRRATVLAEKTLNESGTETIDLNIQQPISRIDIRFRVTKGAYGMASQAAYDVTKIELVDGSEVLHSLSGLVNQAVCIYDRKIGTMSHGQHLISNSDESEFGIDFGRYLYDPLLAFDPTRFRNPQLKITYSRILVDTSGSAAYMEIIAHVFDEKVISPIGFLMSKQVVDQSNPANDSFKYIDLPLDFPIRKLILRAEEDAYAPWSCIEGFKLDEDNEKRIPIDVVTEDYYRIMKGVWTPCQEPLAADKDGDNVTLYVTPTDYWSLFLVNQVGGIDQPYATGVTQGGKGTFTTSLAEVFQGIAYGFLPNHCFEFAFGIQDDLEDWYDVTKVGNLRARVRGGSVGTGGTHQIALEQLRRY